MFNFLLNHTPILYLTQSLWRDEAFSVYLSEPSFTEIIRRTSGDFNPPLYYFLLHIWIGLFGNSVIALRSLSIIAFILLVITVHIFAEKLFKNQKVVWFATACTLFNPMLLYFAFEVRMYSFFALFATLSMYFLHQKKWKWYIVATTLGLYTQPFMAFVILSQVVYAIITKTVRSTIKPWTVCVLLYTPWIPTLITQCAASGPMWIWPVDTTLVLSVVSNVFFGYEGTPPYLWQVMEVCSGLFILLLVALLRDKKIRLKILLFLLWFFIPLSVVLAISFIKPIYVHRYVIFTTVGEVFLLTFAFNHFYKKTITKVSALVFILFLVGINIYTAPFHRKVPLKETFAEIETLWKQTDVILAHNPLVFFESLYYAPDSHRVFLYNPNLVTPPRFVGSIGMPPHLWRDQFPHYPDRAFLVKSDGSFEIVSSL